MARTLVLGLVGLWLAACFATPAGAADVGIVERWATGQPTGATAIAASPDRHVYVVDGAFNRVRKFTSSGQLVLVFGNPTPSGSPAPGLFNGPRGAAVDSLGNVYVTDRGNNRVQKFAPTGQLLDTWGRNGGEFDGPSGIAVDRQNNVYVGDAHGVQKFDATGRFLLRWQAQEAVGLAVAPDGKVYATARAFVHVYGPDGTPLGRFRPRERNARYPDGEGLFDPAFGATSIAVTGRGQVWVSDPGNSRLQLFEADGEFVMACGRRGSATLRLVGNVAAAGDELFATVAGQVVRLAPVRAPVRPCDDTPPRLERIALSPRTPRARISLWVSEVVTVRVVLRRSGAIVSRERIRVGAGTSRIRLRKLIGRRALPAGRYTLRVRATDRAGNASPVSRGLRFRVRGTGRRR